MLSCKKITKLISESFIRRLSIDERLQLWFHIGMCGTCRLFRRLQIQLQRTIQNQLAKKSEDRDDLNSQLSQTARERIQTQIEDRLKND